MRKHHWYAIALVACIILAGTLMGQPPVENIDPGSGGTGGSCTYCSQARCGCASAPLGYMLSYSCACSSIQCDRTCEYTPI